MEVILLVPTLVLLHIVLQSASSTGSLPPPKLSVEPQYPEYFEGEKLALICSAFPNRMVEGYRFFDQDGQQIVKMAADPYQKGKWTFQAQVSNTGSYSCDYWMEKNGTEVTSAQSDSISLQVKEAPAAPSLSLNPELHEYSLGASVSLVCSAPPETMAVKQFFCYGEKVTRTVVVSNSGIFIFNISGLKPEDEGIYRCGYGLNLSGRIVPSKKSNPVTIVQTVDVFDRWGRMFAVGGSFFAINSLIFLFSHWCF